MSTRYEWMYLPEAEFMPAGSDVTTGQPADQDTSDEHLVDGGALVLSGDEVTVVTGTPEALLEWAEDIVALLKRAIETQEADRA